MLLSLNRSELADAHTDGPCAADAADLHYVTDESPGITRQRRGKGFSYHDPEGRLIEDPEEIARIQSLAIPPAYQDVWISPDPAGHIQATGRDARGRKQYRYHPRWGEVRDRAKYARLIDFARILPSLRRKVQRHLRLPGLPRQKVLAACIRLLDETGIRIGNEDYARQNGSFGLTTLQDRHATFARGGVVRLEFNGKHGIERELEVQDSALARIIRQCQDLPGQELIQYLDEEGNVVDVNSGDVNDYLREQAGDFTAKDFRTWQATVLAASALRDQEPASSKTGRNRQIVAAVDAVAAALGNTRAVCRKCYIHPIALESFEANELRKLMADAPRVRGLSPDESATLALLKCSI